MNLNVIRTLTIRSKAEGVQESISLWDRLKAALFGVEKQTAATTAVTDTAAKHQLSLADAVSKAERRFNSALRAQQDFQKVQRDMNRAVAQNPALQERANAVLALARQHFDRAAQGNHAYSRAMQELQSQAMMLSGRLGALGGVLSAMGPGGLVAAAGLGALALGLHHAASSALQLAERAGKLKDFAETTGFTVVQLQALEKAGAQVGVSSESVTKGLERFSAVMVDVQQATGPVYEQLRAINPVLAAQISRAGSLSEAWDLVAKASRQAGLEQRNALARGFFGRGGIENTRLQAASVDAGGIAGLVSQLKEIDRILPEQAKRWDELGDSIAENMKAGKQNVVSVFADPVLKSLNELSAGFLVLSRILKEEAPAATDNEGWFAWLNMWGEKLARMLPLNALVLSQMAKIRDLGKVEIASSAPIQGSPVRFAGGANFDAHRAAVLAEQTKETVRLANEEKRRIDALGGAATLLEKRTAKESELAAAVAQGRSTQAEANRNLADYNRQLSDAALSARISMLGDLASVSLIVEDKQRKINEANRNSAEITSDERAAILEKTRVLAEQSKIENQMVFDRQQLFRTQTEQNIASTLRSQGVAAASERGKAIADYMRMTAALSELNDIAGQFASGFIKDLANGVKPMEALANATKRLADSLIDVVAKQAVSGVLGSVFGEAAGGATQTAGASTAATILTTAGATVAASLVAGATQAAAIMGVSVPAAAATLPVAGAVTGTEVAAGGVAAGTALAVGGAVAGTAIWGPIALAVAALVAAAAAIGLSFMSGAKKAAGAAKLAAEQHAQDQHARSESMVARRLQISGAGDTLAGALHIAEIAANQDRRHDMEQFGGVLGQTERTLGEERQAIIDDFARRAIEAEREIAERRLSFQDRLFTALTDSSTLEGALALFDRDAQREREQELRNGGQALVDLEAALAAERLNVQRRFNEEAVEAQERAQQQQLDAMNAAARNIVDYVQGLLAGPESTLSPSARLFNAQAAYGTKLALAQGGNTDALGSITQDADTLLKAAREFYGSSSGFQAIFQQITSQLLALPAVQTSTDPVVQAMLDVEQAILDQTFEVIEGNTIADAQSAILATIQTFTDATRTNTASQVSLQATQNSLITSANVLSVTANALLNSISGLQNTANANLSQVATGTDRLNDLTLLTTFIRENSRAIAQNTGTTVFWTSAGNVQSNYGTSNGLAAGGVIPPHGLALVSEHSPGGGRFMRAGNEPIAVFPGSPANDNGAVVHELRRLHDRIARLEERLVAAEHGGAERVATAVDRNTAHREDRDERQDQSLRQAARKVAAKG